MSRFVKSGGASEGNWWPFGLNWGSVKVDVAQPGLTSTIDLSGKADTTIAQLQHGPGTTPGPSLGAKTQRQEAALDLLFLPAQQAGKHPLSAASRYASD